MVVATGWLSYFTHGWIRSSPPTTAIAPNSPSGSSIPNETSPVVNSSSTIGIPVTSFASAISALGDIKLEPDIVEAWCRSQGIQAARAIASSKFMEASQERYTIPWVAREVVVQNWADHNLHHRWTLNGVTLNNENIGHGKTRIVPSGNWTIEKPDPFISLDSDKPVDSESGGGNAIGLKQSALRLLRDLGATRFTVEGGTPAKGSWNVDYFIVKAKDINKSLAAIGSDLTITRDWLVGSVSNVPGERNSCSYIIEIENAEVAAAFNRMYECGVCDQNSYLDTAKVHHELKLGGDTSAPHGSIFWQKPDEKGNLPIGRLFVNGQILGAFNDDGSDWKGTHGVSIVLNNTKYKMSIDRPDLDSNDLRILLEPFIKKLPTKTIVEELKTTQYLWQKDPKAKVSYAIKAGQVIVDLLVSELRSRAYTKRDSDPDHYSKENFSAMFGDNIVADQYSLSSQQRVQLASEGYIIAPQEFEGIGAPNATGKLSKLDQVLETKPFVLSSRSTEPQFVNFAKLNEINNVKEFVGLIQKILPGAKIDRISETSTFKIIFPSGRVGVEDMFDTHLTDDKLLHSLRGLTFLGLRNHFINNAVISQGDYLATHATQYTNQQHRLVTQCQNHSSAENSILFRVNDYHLNKFVQAIEAQTAESNLITIQSETTISSTETPLSTITAQPIRAEATTEIVVSITPSKESKQESSERDAAINSLAEIPVEHDLTLTNQVNSGNLVLKPAQYTQDQFKKLDELKSRTPQIVDSLQKLDSLIPQASDARTPFLREINEYLAFRASANLYGTDAERQVAYLSSGTLIDVVANMNQVKIDVVKDDGAQRPAGAYVKTLTQAALSHLNNKLNLLNPRLEINFDIITQPSSEMLQQLEVLRDYVEVATNHRIPNDLFLFTGENRKGVNIGQKAIGLNLELLLGENVSFQEVLGTFVHEVAHNLHMNHTTRFINTDESLHAHIEAALSAISTKLSLGQTLEAKEQMLLHAERTWNSLKEAQIEKTRP